MATKAAIQEFMSQPVLAVAGVSRDPHKFGNVAYRTLKARGQRVLAVNPKVQTVEGDPCYPSLNALPEKVSGLVLITRPAVSEQLVREAAQQGIRHVWLQKGAETPEAVRFCQDHGINVVAGECFLMYHPRAGFPHNLHRLIEGVFSGKAN